MILTCSKITISESLLLYDNLTYAAHEAADVFHATGLAIKELEDGLQAEIDYYCSGVCLFRFKKWFGIPYGIETFNVENEKELRKYHKQFSFEDSFGINEIKSSHNRTLKALEKIMARSLDCSVRNEKILLSDDAYKLIARYL